MRIRQLVRKINKSLGENPNEWRQICPTELVFFNSRGITIAENEICLANRWTGNVELFKLNSNEKSLVSNNLKFLAKPISEAKIGQINKRRGWLCKEILKTL